jgi:hypothetical protein
MSNTNNSDTQSNIRPTSEYNITAYWRNIDTYNTTNNSTFAIRARDIGRSCGISTTQVSRDLKISTTALTNLVRNRNKTDGRFDNIITTLVQAREYRTRTGKVHPMHRSLVHAVSTKYSTRVAAALAGISPSTASVWTQNERKEISRRYAESFLTDLSSINSSTFRFTTTGK